MRSECPVHLNAVVLNNKTTVGNYETPRHVVSSVFLLHDTCIHSTV